VRADSRRDPSPARRSGHIDNRPAILPQPPKGRRRAMRKHSSRPTSQHRRHQPRLPSRHRIPDRIHPLMNSMESASEHPLVNRPHLQTKSFELRQCNKPMLPSRNLSNRLIQGPTGRFYALEAYLRPIGGHLGEADGTWRTGSAQNATSPSRPCGERASGEANRQTRGAHSSPRQPRGSQTRRARQKPGPPDTTCA
jgi:hypothetical protein